MAKMNWAMLSFATLVVVAAVWGLLGGFGITLGLEQTLVASVLAVLGMVSAVLTLVQKKVVDMVFLIMLLVLMAAGGVTVTVPVLGALLTSVGAALLVALVPYALTLVIGRTVMRATNA